MTHEELQRYLHSQGWYLAFHARRATGKRYTYAKRRVGDKVVIRYLCPEDRIATLDEAAVARRLV